MYFWRVERLKNEMAARPLSEREILPYLVVFIFLSIVVTYSSNLESNGWDDLGVVVSALLAVVGTIYIYQKNGGAAGQHFLQRYFALGWVVAIRWLPIFILGTIALRGFSPAAGAEMEGTGWYDFVFLAVGEAIVYWRVGCHVGDLAQRALASDYEPQKA